MFIKLNYIIQNSVLLFLQKLQVTSIGIFMLYLQPLSNKVSWAGGDHFALNHEVSMAEAGQELPFLLTTTVPGC